MLSTKPSSPHDESLGRQPQGLVPVSWPMSEIPVEIFEIITSYLTRAEVKTLRLVCREFEDKVSGQYFRNVVVPFRSELYGNLTRDEDGNLRCSTSNLFSNGMRIFESFGPHIRRFALSLEIDEESLAYPPIKPLQKAVPAFWGVYRWPHETYHRYTDLEGIEQTADEYQGMKEALRYLTNVNNLGLCCDAGLGYLLGPDQGRPSRVVGWNQPVFATRNWREDQRGGRNTARPIITVADFNEVTRRDRRGSACSPANCKRKILEAMFSEAGYTEDVQMDEAIGLMLDAEGASLENLDFDERSAIISGYERRVSFSQNAAGESSPQREANRYPLIPANLTRAQKELLLELEWAHRAMIQSYVIGLIDNAAEGCFTNLTTLTIAKIPSSHLHIICRRELWMSLTSLKNVSLGVLADWRRIFKSDLGAIDDSSISPVEAVGKVFKLLNWYIGPRTNIESVHFEWICGGEFAPSAYQRNSFVLPAPIVESPDLMVMPAFIKEDPEQLLSLPHVRHLSLKNCWSSPHVLVHTLRQMALSSLEKLELESVSLCGPPSTFPQPSLHQINIHHPNHLHAPPTTATLLNLFNPPTAVHPLPPGAPTPTFSPVSTLVTWPQPPMAPADRLSQAQLMCWTGILDHFSPAAKVRDVCTVLNDISDPRAHTWEYNLHLTAPFIPRYRFLRGDELKYQLKCISLKSCGYVLIEAPNINTRATLPPENQSTVTGLYTNGMEMAPLMQHCKDKLCGRIMAYVHPDELQCLENVFGMHTGWEHVYDEAIYEAAVNDGVECPGMGRFSGVLQAKEEGNFPNNLTDYLSDTTLGGSDDLSDNETKP